MYTFATLLSFYAGTTLSMMNRAAQQATKTNSRVAQSIAAAQCGVRLRPTAPAFTRSFSALPARQTIQQRVFRAPTTSRSFSTAQAKSFQKSWEAGAQPWEILDISNSASYAEAQKAYRAIIQKVHPDKNPDNLAAATQATQEANDALAWFKQDVHSRKSNSYSGNTRKQTAEEQRKEKESYEYYKKRASDYDSSYNSSYNYYKRSGMTALDALEAVVYMIFVPTCFMVSMTYIAWDMRNDSKERKRKEREREKDLQERLATFESLKKQVATLYTNFEQQRLPKFLVEQFTQELEELKNETISKLDATRNKEERIDMLRDCNFSLKWAIQKRQMLLEDYNEYNFFKNAVDSYEKTVKEHKETFENSPRKSLLPAETYQLPKGENYRYACSLENELQKTQDKLKSEIAQEKAQQQQEKEEKAQQQQRDKQELYNQNKQRHGLIKALWEYYLGK